MELRHAILVTGSHRSGTTWAGRVLALADGVRYVQEPFNRETNPDINGYRLRNMYAHAHDEDANALRQHYLEFLNPVQHERLLLKDPIALFSAPWIQDEYGAQVVCMVRHPAGFVSSLIKWQWEFHFGYFTSQPALMDSFSPEIRAEIEHFAMHRQEPILQACLLWKTIYGWVADLKPKKRKWLIVRYEDLANQPVVQYKKLFRKLKLEWSQQVVREILNMTGEDKPSESDDPGFKARNAKAMKDVWMSRLDQSQIEIIRKHTEPVWRRYYKSKDWRIL